MNRTIDKIKQKMERASHTREANKVLDIMGQVDTDKVSEWTRVDAKSSGRAGMNRNGHYVNAQGYGLRYSTGAIPGDIPLSVCDVVGPDSKTLGFVTGLYNDLDSVLAKSALIANAHGQGLVTADQVQTVTDTSFGRLVNYSGVEPDLSQDVRAALGAMNTDPIAAHDRQIQQEARKQHDALEALKPSLDNASGELSAAADGPSDLSL